MNRNGPVRQSLRFGICAIAVALLAGCCGPVLRSERFSQEATDQLVACDASGEACDLCECRHVVDHFLVFARAPHALLPGAMAGHRGLIPLQPGEVAQDVPHSKFHPIPTRPVFASREIAPGIVPAESVLVPSPAPEPPSLELELNPSEKLPAPIEPAPIEVPEA